MIVCPWGKCPGGPTTIKSTYGWIQVFKKDGPPGNCEVLTRCVFVSMHATFFSPPKVTQHAA